MAVRSDGIGTYRNILAAAGTVFSDRGYARATIAEICQEAGTNIAAVNYHFGSKERLYAEVWRHAVEEELQANPRDGGIPGDAPAEDRLVGRITALVRGIAGRESVFAALLTRELTHRTAIFEDVRRAAVGPLHRSMAAVIRELLGPDASDRDVLFAEMSVVNQCLGLGLQRANRQLHADTGSNAPSDPSEKLEAHLSEPDGIETLVEHVASFSIAGVRALRAKIEAEAALPVRSGTDANPGARP